MDNFNQNNVKANLHDTNFSRIGVITLSTDFTIEQDFRKICHNLPVDLFFNRIPFLNPLTHENYIKMADHLTETTNQILPNEKIQVVAYGCTSGTIEIGEKRIRSEIFKDILEDIENDFKINVISSNQALIWDSLKLSNIKENKINGFGNLFKI